MYTFKITPSKKSKNQSVENLKPQLNIEHTSIVNKTENDDFHQIFTAKLGERFHKP
ncbi:hypothetical protein ACFL5G_03075 [Candidatus Margulisiibacteriota bacterium]